MPVDRVDDNRCIPPEAEFADWWGGIRGVIGRGVAGVRFAVFDSIAAFTAWFVVVTIAAAWFVTCTPRLSYFGLQVAFAYNFVNLQDFTIQTSLAPARDRVAGILLGLFAMWLFFNRLWGVQQR